MILKNKNIENHTKFNTEICIVGSGMTAQILASNIKNKQIIIVESGKIKFDHKVQELNEIEQIGLSFRKNHKNRLRQLGGSSNLWANQLMTFNSEEIESREWVVNGFSWPISYNELKDYYERIVNLIYKKDFKNNELFEDFKLKYYSKFEDHFLKDKIFNFKYHFWPSKVQKFNLDSKFTKNLIKKNNLKFLENFTCTNLHVDENTKILESVDIRSENKSCKIFAKVFILACGALENARIILNNAEKNKIFKNKNTGRYFMDHPRQRLGILKLKDNFNLNSLYGIKKLNYSFRKSLQLSSKLKKENKLLNSYCFLEPNFSQEDLFFFDEILNDVKNALKFKKFPKLSINKLNINKIFQLIYFILPAQISSSILNNLIYHYLDLTKKKLIFDELKLEYQSEQSPNFDSKIYLSNDFDIFGQKKLIIDWKLNNLDYKTTDFFSETFKKNFSSSVLFSYKENYDREISDASHHSGTTRLSNHRDDGVVDTNSKFHGINNLFLSGSSTFRVSGVANPGLTIMAMALRLSDYINNNL